MNREWYILIDERKEGPFTPLDLKAEPRVTPDTLVWKEGWKEWVPIRFVPELKIVFKDEPESKPLHGEPDASDLTNDLLPEQAALTLQQDPPQFFLWIILVTLIFIYLFYLFNRRSIGL